MRQSNSTILAAARWQLLKHGLRIGGQLLRGRLMLNKGVKSLLVTLQ